MLEKPNCFKSAPDVTTLSFYFDLLAAGHKLNNKLVICPARAWLDYNVSINLRWRLNFSQIMRLLGFADT
jgi:hypothetical protein